jgi:hypothetical protein
VKWKTMSTDQIVRQIETPPNSRAELAVAALPADRRRPCKRSDRFDGAARVMGVSASLTINLLAAAQGVLLRDWRVVTSDNPHTTANMRAS